LIFYQGLTYQKTGDTTKAGRLFADLTETGKRYLDKASRMPDDGAVYNMINKRDLVADGYYLQALGEIGRGNIESAGRLLMQSQNVYKNNLWVNHYLGLYRDVAEIR